MDKKFVLDTPSNGTGVYGRTVIVYSIDKENHRITFDYQGRDPLVQDFYDLCLSETDIRDEIVYGMGDAVAESDIGCKTQVISQTRKSGERGILIVKAEGDSNKESDKDIISSLVISRFETVKPRQSFRSRDLAVLLFEYKCFYIKGDVAFASNGSSRPRDWEPVVSKVKAIECVPDEIVDVEMLVWMFDNLCDFNNNDD